MFHFVLSSTQAPEEPQCVVRSAHRTRTCYICVTNALLLITGQDSAIALALPAYPTTCRIPKELVKAKTKVVVEKSLARVGKVRVGTSGEMNAHSALLLVFVVRVKPLKLVLTLCRMLHRMYIILGNLVA